MITLETLLSLTKFSSAGRQGTLSEIWSNNTGYDFTVTFVKTAGYYGTLFKYIKYCGKLYKPVKVSKVNWFLSPVYVSLFPTKWSLTELTHPELPFKAYGSLECETNVRQGRKENIPVQNIIGFVWFSIYLPYTNSCTYINYTFIFLFWFKSKFSKCKVNQNQS